MRPDTADADVTQRRRGARRSHVGARSSRDLTDRDDRRTARIREPISRCVPRRRIQARNDRSAILSQSSSRVVASTVYGPWLSRTRDRVLCIFGCVVRIDAQRNSLRLNRRPTRARTRRDRFRSELGSESVACATFRVIAQTPRSPRRLSRSRATLRSAPRRRKRYIAGMLSRRPIDPLPFVDDRLVSVNTSVPERLRARDVEPAVALDEHRVSATALPAAARTASTPAPASTRCSRGRASADIPPPTARSRSDAPATSPESFATRTRRPAAARRTRDCADRSIGANARAP